MTKKHEKFPSVQRVNYSFLVVCSLICLDTLEAYIANSINSDQTFPTGASGHGSYSVCFHDQSSLKGI